MRVVIIFAVAKVLFHFWSNGLYGFHRDELATIADARRLDWGYVAYPPLTPFLGRIGFEIFGADPAGIRLLASIAQSICIVLAALMARRFGAGRAGQWVAAWCTAIAPISLAASALFQYVTFDSLWWVLIAFLMLRLLESDDARWWVAIGAVIGLGVMTKYTMVFLVAGIVVATFVFPALRRHLRTRWLWIGVTLSIVIAAPNLIWQWRNDFVSLDFLRHIHERDVRIGRTEDFFLDQLRIAANPATLPLWIAGIVALARSARFRPLLVAFAVPFLLFVIAEGRGYYAGPIYPVLFAAGAPLVERFASWRPRILWPAIAIVLATGVAIAPIVIPLAHPSTQFFRVVSDVNNDLREQIGWPELAREVERIWLGLPDRSRAAALCANYGEAGAIDLYTRVPAISTINSFWQRGPGDPPPHTVIAVGFSREYLDRHFAEVTLAGRIPNPYKLENEESQRPEIYVCRRLRISWPEFWRTRRSFG